MNSITRTQFDFPKQTAVYKGKVRDVYTIDNNYMVMVATDRISAFDVVLPKGIPFKGQVLNQIAAKFLDSTSDIVKNWKIASPDPMVTVGYKCESLPVEMIVRGYLTGSSWRAYKAGAREICGVAIPDGMKEHQKFEKPIITPTTKAEIGGHDQDISREEIIAQGLVSEEIYNQLEKITLALYERGCEIAKERGLILVVKLIKIAVSFKIFACESTDIHKADGFCSAEFFSCVDIVVISSLKKLILKLN